MGVTMLKPNTILHNFKATSKKQALQKIAEIAARETNTDERIIMEQLVERERLGSTGMGKGVAIPHARMQSIDTVFTALITLDQPIDFDAIDEKPVDLMIVLLAPHDAGADHLQALASASRLLRDQELCDKLRGARNVDAIESLLLNYAQAKAA